MEKSICRDKELCTGCTACKSICPKKCITMKPNEEGFCYPTIYNYKCVNCGLCESVCPVNNLPYRNQVLDGYVIRFKSKDIVMDSTSGGSFTAFANYVFRNNGLLYGVGYDKDWRVYHFGIELAAKGRIAEMRGSKYVQSELGDCLSSIKEALVSGNIVCFSGTPCQVAGLKSFLGRDYDNLITVDLVCHGVASPLVFEKYIEHKKSKYQSAPVEIRFRNKTYGYHSGTMKIAFSNGKTYYGSGRVDNMLKGYFAGAFSRHSCYACPFKGRDRCSDFTIFDSWHVDKLVPGLADDDCGFTNLYIHTEKGRKVFQSLKQDLEVYEADISLMEKLDGVMISGNPEKYRYRDQIIHDINQNGYSDTMNKYFPRSFKDLVIEKSKGLLFKMGILSKISK
ncbi:Coenzyme F420 hydrogenase/dehydrogenase, beta subunit C-terminal domain [Macellibacteroides fermentans]|uniref:Coenzyme F420 hydrogenase/dehydrogenase, beta subunit C-terminal domain n=1 Tax=Macellibacteroides fermentans TaxID=879969 RepID=UPI00406BEEC0